MEKEYEFCLSARVSQKPRQERGSVRASSERIATPRWLVVTFNSCGSTRNASSLRQKQCDVAMHALPLLLPPWFPAPLNAASGQITFRLIEPSGIGQRCREECHRGLQRIVTNTACTRLWNQDQPGRRDDVDPAPWAIRSELEKSVSMRSWVGKVQHGRVIRTKKQTRFGCGKRAATVSRPHDLPGFGVT